MSTRNLLINPCWRAKDLGQPLPDSPHAVSVALPRWADVIAYEEKIPSCMDVLQAIYPRFGLNPLVSQVAKKPSKIQTSQNVVPGLTQISLAPKKLNSIVNAFL